MEDRILVWAHPRDARLTSEFLCDGGVDCFACRRWEQLTAEWQRGAAALVIAGELLTTQVMSGLQRIVATQPPWSDVPIIIVGSDGDSDQVDPMDLLGNVSLLQKPVSLKTLRSTVRAALRARRRQYEIRDLLQQKDDADRRKDEFLAMLAHELRNPLAPLRTGLQLLRLHPPPDAVTRTHATMERQLANLTRLVDDLLDVSRITQRKIALKMRPFDLRESVRQAVDAIGPLTREKGLEVEVVLPAYAVVVNADSVRLEQMIGNLLSNSIKFTPSRGSIRVAVDTNDSDAVVRVSDTGVGIPREQLDRVFELFAQTPRGIDRSHGGLGIGLTVVKLLAELHGGTAAITSAGEGLGTEVLIRLPLVTHEPTHDRIEQTQQSAARGRRVLIIEDNPDVSEMLATYLQQIGHQVIVAHDGHAGLEAALRHRPDVLICDIGLPGVDGYAIAERLRREPDLKSCAMIAVTGYGDITDQERARRAGFVHHLTKPADPANVAELIASTMGPKSGTSEDVIGTER